MSVGDRSALRVEVILCLERFGLGDQLLLYGGVGEALPLVHLAQVVQARGDEREGGLQLLDQLVALTLGNRRRIGSRRRGVDRRAQIARQAIGFANGQVLRRGATSARSISCCRRWTCCRTRRSSAAWRSDARCATRASASV